MREWNQIFAMDLLPSRSSSPNVSRQRRSLVMHSILQIERQCGRVHLPPEELYCRELILPPICVALLVSIFLSEGKKNASAFKLSATSHKELSAHTWGCVRFTRILSMNYRCIDKKCVNFRAFSETCPFVCLRF
jgi:hypothetical protein